MEILAFLLLKLFIIALDSGKLEAEIYGIIAGIPIKFNMPNPDGCSQSGITCPVKKSMQYTYKSTFFVLKSYPNVSNMLKSAELLQWNGLEFLSSIEVEILFLHTILHTDRPALICRRKFIIYCLV